jgi:hypothetical protein
MRRGFWCESLASASSTHECAVEHVSRACPGAPMVAVLKASPTRSKVRPHVGTASFRRYERRRPEKTPLHKIVSENLESWLAWREAAERPVPGYVEDELRGYLECGQLCFGFARARCTGCGQAFGVAFSCKGRGVCPSCNGRHMTQTAAHLVDHVIPPVPVRQWVISVPKRLRDMLADRPRAVAALTKIFLDEIERLLLAASGGAPDAERPGASRPRLGGVSFLHRFGSALNHHVHLHACVTDGVFVPAADHSGCDAPPAFLPARPVTPADLAALTERVRRRVMPAFGECGYGATPRSHRRSISTVGTMLVRRSCSASRPVIPTAKSLKNCRQKRGRRWSGLAGRPPGQAGRGRRT